MFKRYRMCVGFLLIQAGVSEIWTNSKLDMFAFVATYTYKQQYQLYNMVQ